MGSPYDVTFCYIFLRSLFALYRQRINPAFPTPTTDYQRVRRKKVTSIPTPEVAPKLHLSCTSIPKFNLINTCTSFYPKHWDKLSAVRGQLIPIIRTVCIKHADKSQSGGLLYCKNRFLLFYLPDMFADISLMTIEGDDDKAGQWNNERPVGR